MSVDPGLVLSPEELTRLEADYLLLPAFAEWADVEVPGIEYWDQAVDELESLRSSVQPVDLERAVSIAMRAAALETGLIENLYTAERGLTITVATQAIAWESQLRQQSGDEAYALFEAQLAAYELVLDAVTHQYPVTEAWLRTLHETLTRPQETYTVITADGREVERPMLHGAYKELSNHVRLPGGGVHVYAPVLQTPSEMARLVAGLQTSEFQDAHPVLQTAYAHYGVVSIHPFCDGNGRVARALGSVYTYRAAGVPLLVFNDERDIYFDALSAADNGKRLPFIQLVSDAAIAAMTLVGENLRTALAPAPATAVANLTALLTAQGGLTYSEIDGIGLRVMSEFLEILARTKDRFGYPPGVSLNLRTTHGTASGPPDEYRGVVVGSQFVGVQLRTESPAAAHRNANVQIFIANDETRRDVFWLLMVGTTTGIHLTLRDVHPITTIATRLRLEALAERILGEELDRLHADAESAFRESGYSAGT